MTHTLFLFHIKRSIQLIILLLCLGLSPSCHKKVNNMEILKQEIYNVEKDFANMVNNKGIAVAFKHFAGENAVILRNEKLIKGKEEIFKLYSENKIYESAQLNWTPDFIEVAQSGELAYTYGKYVFTYIDANGDENTNKGIFHTVWKKQTDGNWKFVWD